MKSIRHLLVLAGFSICLSGSSAKSEPLHCLELKGFGFPYDGGLQFVSSRALKAGGRNGWVLWTKKNVGSLIVINPENKAYMLESVSKHLFQDDNGEELQLKNGSVKKMEDTTICGLKCTKYVAALIPSSGTGQITIEFWTCLQTPCDKTASDAWSQACGIPTGYGLPVRVRCLLRGRTVAMMDTTSVKTVEKPAEFFQLDPSYHPCADRGALMFSKNGQLKAGDLDDLFITPNKPVKH